MKTRFKFWRITDAQLRQLRRLADFDYVDYRVWPSLLRRGLVEEEWCEAEGRMWRFLSQAGWAILAEAEAAPR